MTLALPRVVGDPPPRLARANSARHTEPSGDDMPWNGSAVARDRISNLPSRTIPPIGDVPRVLSGRVGLESISTRWPRHDPGSGLRVTKAQTIHSVQPTAARLSTHGRRRLGPWAALHEPGVPHRIGNPLGSTLAHAGRRRLCGASIGRRLNFGVGATPHR
jgi:hypothetical protein